MRLGRNSRRLNVIYSRLSQGLLLQLAARHRANAVLARLLRRLDGHGQSGVRSRVPGGLLLPWYRYYSVWSYALDANNVRPRNLLPLGPLRGRVVVVVLDLFERDSRLPWDDYRSAAARRVVSWHVYSRGKESRLRVVSVHFLLRLPHVGR